MFDFSQEIKLDQKNYSLYRKLQLLLYLSAIFIAIYLSYLIIFPHKNFYFSFLDPKSSENNLDPPLATNKKSLSEGILSSKKNIYFDATVLDKYSKATINLDLDSENDDSMKVSVRKSHKSFLYETGDPLGFKDGTLLENDNNYFIISNGNLRKFSSIESVNSLGFSKDSFLSVSKEELKYNPVGEDIDNIYPDGSLFLIDENYYILENQKLKKFISDNAFLLNYKDKQAIRKDENFLNEFQISENLAGFPDGTLISNDVSVYIVSQNKIYPIDNPETFLSKGYAWEDVVPAGTDELSIYEKQKLFNVKTPHPNGTVFKTDKNYKYYIIRDEKKLPLLSEKIALTWISKNPVLVSEESLKIQNACEKRKTSIESKNYVCEILLESLSAFPGFNYQFKIESEKEIKINSINADFKKNIDINNLKEFRRKIISEIKINYGIK